MIWRIMKGFGFEIGFGKDDSLEAYTDWDYVDLFLSGVEDPPSRARFFWDTPNLCWAEVDFAKLC